MSRFTRENFDRIVDELTSRDADLKRIVDVHGYPPMWSREEGFETLVLIILEQQVSLASAFAAFTRLKEFTQGITPESVLALTDEEMRSCYFSRQKTIYVRDLARRIQNGQLDFSQFGSMPEEDVRNRLKEVKGIADWTADVYLMFCLQCSDYFPLGDVALVNSLRFEKSLDPSVDRDALNTIAEKWRPWRTVASMILWHAYIRRKAMRLPDSYKKETG